MVRAFEICEANGTRVVRVADGGLGLLEADPCVALEGIGLAAECGLKLDREADGLVREAGARLADVERTRLFAGIERILLGEFAGRTILAYADVLAQAIPVLGEMDGCPQNSPFHVYDVLEHTAHVVDGSPATPVSRWAALFHDAGKPKCRWTDKNGRDHFTGHAAASTQIADDALAQLGAPAKLHDDVCTLVERHEWFTPADDEGLQVALAKLGGRVDLYQALLSLQVADSSAKSPAAAHRLQHVRAMRECLDAFLRNA